MPQTDPASVIRTSDYWHGASTDFASMLAGAFDEALDAIDANDDERALVYYLLHGQGKFSDGSLDLAVGAGLSCQVANGQALILGHLVLLSDEAGYGVVSLEALTTSYIYIDGDGVLVASTVELVGEARPDDYVFLGTAVTSDVECTSVDDSGADILAETATLPASVAAIEAALGMPWGLEDDAQTILATLMAGGSSTEDPISWSTLQKVYGSDSTTIVQEIVARLLAHVAAYHAATDDDDLPSGVTINIEQWEVDAANFGQSVLAITRKLDANHPDEFQDAIVVVHGVYGDGTGSTPDWVDHVNSTWS